MQTEFQPRRSCSGTGFLAVDIVLEGSSTTPSQITAGGTCANVLSFLALFGWNARPIARLGNDAAARVLVSDLEAAGVMTDGLRHSPQVATPMIVHRFGLGSPEAPRHRFEWTCPSCGTHLPRFRPTPTAVLREAMLADTSTLFYCDRATPGSYRLAMEAKEKGAIVVFEPPRLADDPIVDRLLSVADIVKLALSRPDMESDERLASTPMVIETLGEDGLRYKLNGFLGLAHKWVHREAFSSNHVVDTCGSGDWLTAGFLHGMFGIEGGSVTCDRIDASIAFGQALAALNCEHPGARALLSTYRREEIAEMAAMIIAEGCAAARLGPSICRLDVRQNPCSVCTSNVEAGANAG